MDHDLLEPVNNQYYVTNYGTNLYYGSVIVDTLAADILVWGDLSPLWEALRRIIA